ncbi:MAG: GyrI-like domain-containing protein [Spirochaetales bacterium]|nr:GyrI-like domain-containing protein [Spirochaetales bacterium]
MDKIDMKKTIKVAFGAKAEPAVVVIPAMNYITFAGHGNPNGSQLFQDAVGLLYGLAYTLKFAAKGRGQDFVVMPLEGQWWCNEDEIFDTAKKDQWFWKLMIALPDFISQDDVDSAKVALKKKKNPPMIDDVLFERMEDGESVQILHTGPYSEEAPTIARLHEFARDNGYSLCGRHREVYLSNPERTLPDKMKTVIRHPVVKK